MEAGGCPYCVSVNLSGGWRLPILYVYLSGGWRRPILYVYLSGGWRLPILYVYLSGGWRLPILYVYLSGGWRRPILYVYLSGGWKPGGLYFMSISVEAGNLEAVDDYQPDVLLLSEAWRPYRITYLMSCCCGRPGGRHGLPT